MKKILSLTGLFTWLILTFFATPIVYAQVDGSERADSAKVVESEIVTADPIVYIFGRDDCGFCKALLEWIDQEPEIKYEYLNIITDVQAKTWYDQVAEKHEVSKVTPITVIGERVLVGYNGAETTGESIKLAVAAAKETDIRTIPDHIERAPKQSVVTGGGCSGLSCDTGKDTGFTFDLPFLGIVDLKSFSLFSLSITLGIIDGFNPCAMWVLITFLVLLSQAGSKKKMIFLASIFIVAEAVMYNLILNVWYKTWDFVSLDRYVTPLVGVIAVGGGIFFLWRWSKNKEAQLICDITNIETQSKTISRFKSIAEKPITLLSVLAILVIAFSVNIIEFACSVGIPQAYTKILELNLLTFMERQWYIMIYTIGYMIDDFIVFGLAIWGYDRLQAHGGKYARMSLLIGGILMLMLGSLLILNPSLLVL